MKKEMKKMDGVEKREQMPVSQIVRLLLSGCVVSERFGGKWLVKLTYGGQQPDGKIALDGYLTRYLHQDEIIPVYVS